MQTKTRPDAERHKAITRTLEELKLLGFHVYLDWRFTLKRQDVVVAICTTSEDLEFFLIGYKEGLRNAK